MTIAKTNTWVGRGTPMSVEEITENVMWAWNEILKHGQVIYPASDEDFMFVVDNGDNTVLDKGEGPYVSEAEPMFEGECFGPTDDPLKIWWEYYGYNGFLSFKDEGAPTESQDPAWHHFASKYGFPLV
jgi:hypothetical protein